MNPISIPPVTDPREPAAAPVAVPVSEDDRLESFGAALLMALGAMPVPPLPIVAQPVAPTTVAAPAMATEGESAPAAAAGAPLAGRLPLDPELGVVATPPAAMPEPEPQAVVPAGAATRPAVEPAITEPAPLVAAALADVDVVRLSVTTRLVAEPVSPPPATSAPARENAAPSPVAAATVLPPQEFSGSSPDPGRGGTKQRRATPAPSAEAAPAPLPDRSVPAHAPFQATVPAPPVAAPATPVAAAPPAAPPAVPTAPRAGDHVTLQLGGEGGWEGRVRVALRGQSLHATIVSHDPAATRQLQHDVGELQQALAERGFAGARIVVHDGRPADSTSHERPESRAREDSRDRARHDTSRETPGDRSQRRNPRPQAGKVEP